jgi:hypothetical protein
MQVDVMGAINDPHHNWYLDYSHLRHKQDWHFKALGFSRDEFLNK